MSNKIKEALFLTFLIAITALYQGMASAACGTEYSNNISINTSASDPFPANGTYGLDIDGGGIQFVWCGSGSNQLCYNDSSTYACYQDDTKKMTLIDEGSGIDISRDSLDPSLILWMNMSGSGDDASLYRLPSTSSGTLSKGEGKIGYGMNFDSAYYNFGNQIQFDGLSNITVMAWIWVNVSSNQHIINKADVSATAGWALDREPSGCVFAAQVGGSWQATTKAECPVGEWVHVAGTYDGDELRIYVNGTLGDSDAGYASAITSAAGESLYVGVATWEMAATFDGLMDDVRVYNRTLSGSEIESIYLSYESKLAPAPPAPPVISIPDITFVPPTIENSITGQDYEYINLTVNESANCVLEWNGVNESMSNLSENYYLNKTLLLNGNYTFKAYCDNAAGINMTEDRWVYVNRTDWMYFDDFIFSNCVRAGTSWTNQDYVWDKDYGTFGYNSGTNQANGYCEIKYENIPTNVQKIKLQFKIGQSGSTCEQTSNITYPLNCTLSGTAIFRLFSNNDGAGNSYTEIQCKDNTSIYIPIFYCKGQLSIDNNIWGQNFYYGYGDAPEAPPTPPDVAFISPTPINEIVTSNYTFINVSMSTGGDCLLEWNGVNESMSNLYDMTLYVNKTDLGNGNYTFLSYCQDSLGTPNMTESRWVFINYTAPPIAPPTINIAYPSNGAIVVTSWVNITGTATSTIPDSIYTNDTNFGINKGTYGNWNFSRSGMTNGIYSVMLTANDTSGNTASSSVTFNLSIPPAPPAPTPAPVSSQLPFLGFIFGFMGILIALGFLDMKFGTKGGEGWKDQLGLALAVVIGVILVVLAYTML